MNGVSFTLETVGAGCSSLKLRSSVTLPPPTESKRTSQSGGFGVQIPMIAPLNPWTYHQIVGKITGQDIANVDMLWNRPHLGWWEDGYVADYGSWWEDDGVDPFWNLTNAFTFYNTTQHGVNNFFVTHQRDFHSDGFPAAYKAVNASTAMTLTGYYNGYATCGNFSHNYDSGALWYPNLHWHTNECYWES
jgi:hypothetical protein